MVASKVPSFCRRRSFSRANMVDSEPESLLPFCTQQTTRIFYTGVKPVIHFDTRMDKTVNTQGGEMVIILHFSKIHKCNICIDSITHFEKIVAIETGILAVWKGIFVRNIIHFKYIEVYGTCLTAGGTSNTSSHAVQLLI